ncbi:MAG: AAC(3) family N-acetyltransferase [Bacteroidota bacterium]|nr:AAC(3) family N-acetyltransferase [Bacteroidota bacterium]
MDDKKLRDKFVSLIAEKTKHNSAAFHIDLIGLIRLGKSNEERLEEFCDILRGAEMKGGSFCIPAYSLSYTKNEDYNIKKTPSEVGLVAEYIRKKFSDKRTVDALFSYITFGNKISDKHFEVQDYESFGKNSLIEELFETDGYICSIGGVFRNCTEIHFIEKLLDVKYRSDKIFKGSIIDYDDKIHNQQTTYFCKTFDHNLWYDFKNLEQDLKRDGLMEIFKVDGLQFFVEGIKFSILYEYIERKIKNDYQYFIKELKLK